MTTIEVALHCHGILKYSFSLNRSITRNRLNRRKPARRGYMCVVLVYFLNLRMSIFETFMVDDKLVTL